MLITNDKMQKIISEETNKAWNTESEKDLVAFVQKQIELAGHPLTQDQLIALTNSLNYITKAITKQTMIAWVNVSDRVQSDQK